MFGHPQFFKTIAMLCIWVGLGAMVLPVAAQPTAPGAGFSDPQGLAPRAPTPDIEPVYRRPGVDTLATIRKRGSLRVGVVHGAPMVMQNNAGELTGLGIDLGRRLADDLGVQVAFVETSWPSVIPDLLGRQFDLIVSDLWVTAQRALVVNFSNAITVESIYLVASKTSAPNRKTRADFNQSGTRIAVYGATTQEQVARRLFPQATLVRLSGSGNALQAVLDNEADAALVPTVSPQRLVAEAPDRLYLPLAQPLSGAMVALAVRKGDPEFLAFLNTWLDMQRYDGWLGERAEFWSNSTDR